MIRVFISLLPLLFIATTVCAGERAPALEAPGLNRESLLESRVQRHLEAAHRLYRQGNQRGIVYRSCPEYEEAIAEFSLAMSLDSASREAYSGRGSVLQQVVSQIGVASVLAEKL